MTAQEKALRLIIDSPSLSPSFKADMVQLLDDTEGGLVNALELSLKYIGILERKVK